MERPPFLPRGADRCVRHSFPVGRTAVSAIPSPVGRTAVSAIPYPVGRTAVSAINPAARRYTQYC
jgi:hypothetical protein